MTRSRKKPLDKARIDLRAIGRRIRELRGFYMTQAEFASRIGVTQGYLSALEHGEKEPGAAVLLAISRQFGKSVDWLLTGRPQKWAKNAGLCSRLGTRTISSKYCLSRGRSTWQLPGSPDPSLARSAAIFTAVNAQFRPALRRHNRLRMCGAIDFDSSSGWLRAVGWM